MLPDTASAHLLRIYVRKGSIVANINADFIEQATSAPQTTTPRPSSANATEAARLEDVARAAGVSLATASKALHNRPRVSQATRERVLAAAESLNYRPNALAQSLATGLTNTVGLVTSDLQGRFCTPILIGVENELSAKETSVLLTNARNDHGLERRDIDKLLSLRVDGIIALNPETNPRHSLGSIGIPVVYAYAPSDNADDCSVTVDNVEAGRLAINHLISCGRSKIAIIGGDETFTATTDRIKGSLSALAEVGLEPVGPIRYGRWDENWGRAGTRLLLDQGYDFDAVVCQNDQLARGCIDALKQRGLSIPGDVAVIGHDNWDVLTQSSRPALTSIDNELEIIGRKAAQLLMDAINGHPHHGVTYVPPRLVQRESTLPLD